MKTSTTVWRTLALCVVLAGAAGTAHAQRTVTLRLNTATLPDTIKATSLVEVRGAAGQSGATAPATLPDDNIIDWNANSTLEPTNIGGDYWEISFQVANTDSLQFKFYSQQAEDAQLNGWESDPNEYLVPGTNDTTYAVHYFEWQGRSDPGNYYWRPWEQKQDSIAVWFRVYMDVADATNRGFKLGETPVGVRGDNFDPDAEGPLGGVGPLDWGITQVMLEQESTDNTKTGYKLYSGVAHYPASLAGRTQAYKFFFGTDGWENDPNRTFVIPSQDTTLQWVFFSRDKPNTGVEPVTGNVLFNVDLSPLETIGLYKVSRGDTLEIRGDFNGWDCAGDGAPDDCLLQRVTGTNEYEGDITLTRAPQTSASYKFFINFKDDAFVTEFGKNPPQGWEEPFSTTGANRTFVFEGEANQSTGLKYFNDILPENVIPAGTNVDVTFSVDMSTAASGANGFDAATDTVWIHFGDEIWRFTQGIEQVGDQGVNYAFPLSRQGETMVYSGTLAVEGPTYSGIQYKYGYGARGTTKGTIPEPGGDTSTSGRRRVRYIVPTSGGWPTAYSLTTAPEQFRPETGPLPYECNPSAPANDPELNPEGCVNSGDPAVTGIEDVGGAIPTAFDVESNFPNPFSGKTAFRYTLPQAQHVTVRVYDVTGRVVATLVDGVQAASTYEVTFDGEGLSSGIYFYRVQTDRAARTGQMMLVR